MAKERSITAAEIEKGLQTLFPSAIKRVDIEEDEEKNYFFFEIEFVEQVDNLTTPDGIFIGHLDFKERYVEGVIDGVAFLEFVDENKSGVGN
jgi:hypothetical protein